jgi:hypothetical protein
MSRVSIRLYLAKDLTFLGNTGNLKRSRPFLLILGGDLFDCYSISRYEKDPRRLHETLPREFDAAQGFACAVGRLGCEVVYLLGNHECRLDAIVAAHPGLGGLLPLQWPQIASLPDSWDVHPNQTRYRIGSLEQEIIGCTTVDSVSKG